GQAILDGGGGVEGLGLDVQPDVLRRDPVQADAGRVADGVDDAVIQTTASLGRAGSVRFHGLLRRGGARRHAEPGPDYRAALGCQSCGCDVPHTRAFRRGSAPQIQTSFCARRSDSTSPVFTTPRGSISIILTSCLAYGLCSTP